MASLRPRERNYGSWVRWGITTIVAVLVFFYGGFYYQSTTNIGVQGQVITLTSTVTVTSTSTYIPPPPAQVNVEGFAKTVEYRTTTATGLIFVEDNGVSIIATFANGNYTATLANNHSYKAILLWKNSVGQNGQTTCDSFRLDVGYGTGMLLMDWAC